MGRTFEMLRILSVVLMAAMLGGSVPEVATLDLPDLYGSTDRLENHRGEVVVVFVVTARRLRNVKAWEKALRERFEEIRFVRIADLPADSSAGYDDVAARLRKRVPEGVRVLIDLDRAWATELSLDTARPNVLVFDSQGRLRESVRGLLEPSLLETVAGALEQLEAGP